MAGGRSLVLEGGLGAWRRAGLPVVEDRRAPLPIMRQVQIGAGSLVLAGVVLAVLVSPWFMVLSAFVGGGLVLAGATGFCGMARLLMLMPWNAGMGRPASGRAGRAGADSAFGAPLNDPAEGAT